MKVFMHFAIIFYLSSFAVRHTQWHVSLCVVFQIQSDARLICHLVQRLVLRAFDELQLRAGSSTMGDISFWTISSAGQRAFR